MRRPLPAWLHITEQTGGLGEEEDWRMSVDYGKIENNERNVSYLRYQTNLKTNRIFILILR